MGWLEASGEREREIAPALRANEHILMGVLMLQKKKGEGRGETKKFQVEGSSRQTLRNCRGEEWTHNLT